MEKNNTMTAERSLEIIRESIERSRRETTRNAGKPLLMWGALVMITSLTIGHLLKQTGNSEWQYLWLVLGILGGAGQYLLCRNEKAHAKNFTGEIVGNIWIAFAVFCFCTFIIGTLALRIRFEMQLDSESFILPITAMIIIMEALCAAIMGLVLRNVWITVCAVVSGVICTAVAVALPDVRSMLALALAAVLNLIVPGLIIVIGNKNNGGGSSLCSDR